MPDPRLLAERYLAPPAGAYWRWTDGGETLSWNDGGTIAFRTEVGAVLDRLALGGFPPFGGVVLLMATFRADWGERSRALERMVLDHAARTGGGFSTPAFRRDIERLSRLARLGPRFRSLAAKAAVAEVIFEPSGRRGLPDDAAAIVRGFGLRVAPEPDRTASTADRSIGVFLSDLETLLPGLSQDLDDAAIDRLVRTGIAGEVGPADLPVAPPEACRALLLELEGDRELGGLARLARSLSAVVHVPRSLAEADDLPLGGISDLATRGPLDRLTVSELAHDDTTLALRVALGEALYLRRERPSSARRGARAILVDTGIRLWGTPRVFATAVALALVASAGRGTPVRAFRSRGGGIEPAVLHTREGILEHLARLDPAPHPGESLRVFLEALANASDAGDSTGADAILVTHEDVPGDPEFRPLLRAAGPAGLHVATVRRDGRFRLTDFTRHGEKLIGEATLSLDAIAPSPRPAGAP